MSRFFRWAWLGLFGGALGALWGCTAAPSGVEPVHPFEVQRYLGTWYEIARLDHSFERGLEQVSATYRMQQDGAISVLNRGYNPAEQRWQQIEGRALPVGNEQSGHLKVSFFGPFYSAYVVFGLDPQYQYAFVAGYSKDYLWLLARTPTVSQEVWAKFLQEAKARGFDTQALIRVMQATPAS